MSININDYSGKPEYKTMRQKAYEKADIILLCYSMMDKGKSASRLVDYWIEELGEYGPQSLFSEKLSAQEADHHTDMLGDLNNNSTVVVNE